MLDPWSSGGILSNISDTQPAVYQPGGGHHFDLRSSNPADTPAVLSTRAMARALITQWMANRAPATPVYTAPSTSWRQSYVVLLAMVCTVTAMGLGWYVYSRYLAGPSAAQMAAAAVSKPAAGAPSDAALQAGAYAPLVEEKSDAPSNSAAAGAAGASGAGAAAGGATAKPVRLSAR
jgi:hypothetical protein